MDSHIHTDMTKRLLTDSLKRLMAQKPLNKITIREITEGCGVNRQTFYYHFEDIYDLLRWMYRQEALALLDQREGVLIWQDGLLQLFRYLQENRAVCLCALHSVSREHLKRFFRDDINSVIQNTIQNLAAQLNYPASDREIDLLTRFYVSALAGITEDWLQGEIRETPEELIRFTDQLLRSHVMGAKLRLAGENMDFNAEEGGR